jgi:YVTN family beta-propeller protein
VITRWDVHQRRSLSVLTAAALVAGCGGAADRRQAQTAREAPAAHASVYAGAGAGMLAPAVRGLPTRVYVPNSGSDTVDVIDPLSMRVLRRFAVGAQPQHVTPAWDLRRLWVDNDHGNSLTPIDPRTGLPGRAVAVSDPYNLYFTKDGRFAIVVAEALRRLDFRSADTMRLRRSLPLPCPGIDHMDFTADGRYALASCEFGARMIRIDIRRRRLAGIVSLPHGSKPQDVKLSANGQEFFIADKARGGVYRVAARRPRLLGFTRTGADAHGLYPSRDGRRLYVTNRGAGTVSVLTWAGRRVATWRIPHGSPDMGGVSADGRTLWLTGRYNREVYAIDTRTGRLRARIPVGAGPHGLSIFPQPGRHSLGHTGTYR